MKKLIIALISCIFFSCAKRDEVRFVTEINEPDIAYAIASIQSTIGDYKTKAITPGIVKLIMDTSSNIQKEGYRFDIIRDTLVVSGSNTRGISYGISDLGNKLAMGARLHELDGFSTSPQHHFRAIKFNLPWNSYRRSEALQMHTEVCRDINFWKSFLDMMYENKFNALTLWNLHPFPYLIRPENFPEASPFTDAELKEWKTFWKQLFYEAKIRGIETYLVNWNIFVSPEFAKKHGVAAYSSDGTYFTKGDTSEIIKAYTRECIKQVINEFPNLTGLGVSLGEAMGGMTPEEREQWIFETFIEGMKQADRKIKFIHRLPFSANKGSGGSTNISTEKMTREAIERIKVARKPVLTEIKYNWSHGHSAPRLYKVHGGKISDTYWNPPPNDYLVNFMIRNEDFFCLRWGQSDFIKELVHNNSSGKSYVGGYYIGSECYIPAVDYFSKDKQNAGMYAFQRQWYYYKLWGNLLYNTDLSDNDMADFFVQKYGSEAEWLFEAWNHAGKTPLLIGTLMNGNWDFTLYSEGFLSIDPDGITRHISLEDIIRTSPLDTSFISIYDEIHENISAAGKKSALHLADSLLNSARLCEEIINTHANKENHGFHHEIIDLKSWCHLANYVANKLYAGYYLEKYRKNKSDQDRSLCQDYMDNSVGYWKQLAELTSTVYKEMPLVHLSVNEDESFHWARYIDSIQADYQNVFNE